MTQTSRFSFPTPSLKNYQSLSNNERCKTSSDTNFLDMRFHTKSVMSKEK